MRAVLHSALTGAAVGVLVATFYLVAVADSSGWWPIGFFLSFVLLRAADQVEERKEEE